MYIRTTCVAIVFNIALWVFSAAAQITFQPSTASFGAVMGGQQAAIQQDLHRSDRARRNSGHPSDRRQAPVQHETSTTYQASQGVTERVKRQFIEYVSQRSPEDGARVRSDLGRIDPTAAWARIVAEDGLRPGDVADAYAAYWILNWAVVTDGDNHRVQSLAVRDQVRSTMSRNATFQRLDGSQRQEMAEALMLNFLYQHDVFIYAKKTRNQELVAKLKQVSLARFQNEMKIDLRTLDLTDHGFVGRGLG